MNDESQAKCDTYPLLYIVLILISSLKSFPFTNQHDKNVSSKIWKIFIRKKHGNKTKTEPFRRYRFLTSLKMVTMLFERNSFWNIFVWYIIFYIDTFPFRVYCESLQINNSDRVESLSNQFRARVCAINFQRNLNHDYLFEKGFMCQFVRDTL